MSESAPTITWPRCGMASAHPTDIAEGYCGNCHDWTRNALVNDLTRAKAVVDAAPPNWNASTD